MATSGLAQSVGRDFVSTDISTFTAGVICTPVLLGQTVAPDTIAGHTNQIGGEVHFSSASRRVPAVEGLSFGVRAATKMQDYPRVIMTVSHPPMGNQGTTQQSWPMELVAENDRISLFSFQHDYELVRGAWSFEARSGETVLYRANFEVVDPTQVPELADMCGFAEMLS